MAEVANRTQVVRPFLPVTPWPGIPAARQPGSPAARQPGTARIELYGVDAAIMHIERHERGIHIV
jgi:hypothetical protein